MVLRITSSGTSLAFALEAVAALVLCAVKVVISIPESFKTSLVHLEIVSRNNALCGRIRLINNCFTLFLRGFVFWMYSFNVVSGQSFGSGVYSLITRGLHFWPGLLVLCDPVVVIDRKWCSQSYHPGRVGT